MFDLLASPVISGMTGKKKTGSYPGLKNKEANKSINPFGHK